MKLRHQEEIISQYLPSERFVKLLQLLVFRQNELTSPVDGKNAREIMAKVLRNILLTKCKCKSLPNFDISSF